jgi:NADPH:quinone reductase-like Zn-dependent oxidoreductase
MMETEAWVLHQGERQRHGQPQSAELVRESFPIAELADDEVLAEPIYGCWEGNMTHALERVPVDVCRFRREPRVVLGNAGVVRIAKVGASVMDLVPGDVCMVFPNAEPDAAGYMVKALAYDARKTMGVLARHTRLPRRCLIPIPPGSRHSLRQWAAFSLRYVTAWSNWHLAFGCYRLQMPVAVSPQPFVVAWGGGVALGQLVLAQHDGCKVAMIASTDHRLTAVRDLGIIGIDRREFAHLYHEPERYHADAAYRRSYDEAEATFLARIAQAGGGQPVAVFIDHIGTPVYRATLAALGRQGVITSAGWKHGADLVATRRASECIGRHLHINTHYAGYAEGLAATAFAEEHGWLPPIEGERVYRWDEIPELARDYAQGRVESYFPLFQVNAE